MSEKQKKYFISFVLYNRRVDEIKQEVTREEYKDMANLCGFYSKDDEGYVPSKFGTSRIEVGIIGWVEDE